MRLRLMIRFFSAELKQSENENEDHDQGLKTAASKWIVSGVVGRADYFSEHEWTCTNLFFIDRLKRGIVAKSVCDFNKKQGDKIF